MAIINRQSLFILKILFLEIVLKTLLECLYIIFLLNEKFYDAKRIQIRISCNKSNKSIEEISRN